jgi:hypothetical protein
MVDRESPNALNFAADWRYGLNLNPSQKATVGYLLEFSGCGGLTLSKDIEVWNPFDSPGQTVISGDRVKCIGLIEQFTYEGGEGDPIRIRVYVSKGNAADIRAKLARPLTNTSVKLAWYIIDFDNEKKLWFEAAFLKKPKKADSNVDSSGGELQLFVDNEATPINDVLDIGVYAFEFQVVPADKKKATLEFATGPQRRLLKQWGEG